MTQTKDFDVDEITVFVDGERVGDLDAVGWDSSQDNELERTIGDDGNVWVLAHEEPEVTVAVKNTSKSIPRLEQAYQNQETISITLKYAEVEPRTESQFLDGKFNSFGPDDDYDDGIVINTGEASFDRVEHEYDEDLV